MTYFFYHLISFFSIYFVFVKKMPAFGAGILLLRNNL